MKPNQLIIQSLNLLIIIFLFCFLINSLLAQPARPARPIVEQAGRETWCGVTWLPAVKLSPEGTTGYISRMTVQGDTVHLVFENSDTYRLPYVRSTNAGIDWEPIRELIIDTVQFPYWNVSNLKIASNDKKLYIFFIGGSHGSGQTPIFMLSSSDHGDSWTEPRAINQGNPFPRNVAILGDT
ncbi:MAG: sialidase family protein, partial [Bacteroidota bacterium]|nr:sialidase family protein [Bacteroidota bacterium]